MRTLCQSTNLTMVVHGVLSMQMVPMTVVIHAEPGHQHFNVMLQNGVSIEYRKYQEAATTKL